MKQDEFPTAGAHGVTRPTETNPTISCACLLHAPEYWLGRVMEAAGSNPLGEPDFSPEGARDRSERLLRIREILKRYGDIQRDLHLAIVRPSRLQAVAPAGLEEAMQRGAPLQRKAAVEVTSEKATNVTNVTKVTEATEAPGKTGSQGRPLSAATLARRVRTAALTAVAARLAEPFGSKELAAAGRVEVKVAANWLFNRKCDGWVKRAGWGKYVRTGKFPAAVIPTAEIKVGNPAATTNVPCFDPAKRNPGDGQVGSVTFKGDKGQAGDKEQVKNAAARFDSKAAAEAGRALAEPFTLLDLTARCDGGSAQAGQWLAGWLQKRWIERASYGQYKRTEAFPEMHK